MSINIDFSKVITKKPNVNLDISVFSTLYKQNTSGKIQQWSVSVKGNEVTCVYGQVNGKMQETTDIVKKGKNIGKVNETTPAQQAILKAQQLFEKKVKEGYVENIEIAKENKNNLEGVTPMLAFDIDKKKKYVTFPAYVQPKLDGFRCLAVVKDGKCKLYSRTQKEINTLPHIVEEIESMFGGDIVLDGEIYNHELKNEFQKIQSIVKRDEVHDQHEIIQYHIYDILNTEKGFGERTKLVNFYVDKNAKYLKIVPTINVLSEEFLETHFHDFLAKGYEGAMYRNAKTPYEQKRSPSLLKLKIFEDAEFEVFDVVEGAGKLMGTAGSIWVKELSTNIKFKAKLKSYEDNNGKRIESKEDFQKRCKDWFENFDKYKGKMLTVKFQGRSVYNVPRFPVALRLREEI